LIAQYIRVGSIDEGLKVLEEHRPWGRVLAGGTDLLPKTRTARHKRSLPLVLIDIKRIDELKGIQMKEGRLCIGPSTTMSQLAGSELVLEYAPVLSLAAGQVGSPEIRNRGTVGGNLGSKNTGADLLAPLAAMGALVEVRAPGGTSEIPVRDLLAAGWQGLGRSSLITEVRVPVNRQVTWGYRRWSRESMGRAYITALAGLEPRGDDRSCRFTAVLGGPGLWPRTFECQARPGELSGQEPMLELCSRAAAEIFAAAGGAGGDYQFQIGRVALAEALELAAGEVGQ